MKKIFCDICKKAISGFSHKKHVTTINNGTVEFIIDIIEGDDICYYCASKKAYEAAKKWKTEADNSM